MGQRWQLLRQSQSLLNERHRLSLRKPGNRANSTQHNQSKRRRLLCSSNHRLFEATDLKKNQCPRGHHSSNQRNSAITASFALTNQVNVRDQCKDVYTRIKFKLPSKTEGQKKLMTITQKHTLNEGDCQSMETNKTQKERPQTSLV